MRRVFKPAEPEIEAFPLRCSGGGCPLNGTLSNSSGDGAKWYCSIHFNNYNPRLTNEIMERKTLIEAVIRAMNLTMFDWQRNLKALCGWLEGQQRTDLFPTTGELNRAWADRVFRLLKKECISAANATTPVRNWND